MKSAATREEKTERGGRGERGGDAEGWPRARLGNVCDIAIGKTPSRDQPRYWRGDLAWAAISDIKSDIITETAERITAVAAAECRCRIVPAGTLLFSFKLSIGKMAFAGCDLYTNEAIAALTPLDPRQLSKHFLRFALAATDCTEGSSHAVKGKTLNQDGLHALEIPLPPLPEQERIAGRLTEQRAAVERARAAAMGRLTAAEFLPAAYLREVFEGPEASGWETRQLGDLLRRHNDIIHPGDRKSGEAVFVGLEHIEPDTGRRIGSLTIDLGKMAGRKPTFLRGQIVYGYLRPYLNKVWIADFDGCSSVDQFAFAVRQDLADTGFVAAFMRSATFLRRSEVVTTTGQLPRISIDEIEAVQIELPPTLADQRRIAADLSRRLAGAEHLAAGVRSELAAIESLPAALLRAACGGPEVSHA